MTDRGKRRDERKREKRAVTHVKRETHRCNESIVFS